MFAEVSHSLWESIRSEVVSALILLIGAGAAAIVAWLRSKARQWSLAQKAVREIDESEHAQQWLSGQDKRREAINILRRSAPGIDEGRAAALVDRAVEHSVRPAQAVPDSDSPPPLPLYRVREREDQRRLELAPDPEDTIRIPRSERDTLRPPPPPPAPKPPRRRP